jgi:NADH:ubiquinone oxidoreductase subunit F (NADH-binding)
MTAPTALAGPDVHVDATGVVDADRQTAPVSAASLDALASLDGFATYPRTVSGTGGVGGPGTLLLAGPPAGVGGGLDAHRATWGPLPDLDGAGVRTLLRSSGLDGRGGGGFPLGRKIETARLAGGDPVLVVNASESEPASAKDRTLCAERPHLVLDGAALAAAALGVRHVVVHLHRAPGSPASVLETAMRDRAARGVADPSWRLSAGPDRYVSGEASAVAAFVNGGEARPLFTTRPLAVVGPSGRPTVVTNAETVAHLAVLVRTGSAAWAARGDRSSPGPRLVTLAGAVGHPGRVLEVAGSPTIGDILHADGVDAPPAAVLVGGYAGTWVLGADAWQTPWTREALAAVAAGPGCGLLGVLPHGSCGLHETARLVAYLAGESAGQCGTCVAGLPRLAEACAALAAGDLRRRGVRRMIALGDVVHGSGACGHPDAVVGLVHSMLDVFEDDVVGHMAGHPCRGTDHPPVFPVPDPPAGIGVADRREWR